MEFKRYLHRFLLEFTRIETLGAVRRTIYNQNDSLVRPLHHWLVARGVRMMTGCRVTDIDHTVRDGRFTVTGLHYLEQGQPALVAVDDADLVILQNGSMTDASSLGSMTSAPVPLTRTDSGGWDLWERLAAEPFELGNPAAFDRCIAQSCWESFTVTSKDPAFFDRLHGRIFGARCTDRGLRPARDWQGNPGHRPPRPFGPDPVRRLVKAFA